MTEYERERANTRKGMMGGGGGGEEGG